MYALLFLPRSPVPSQSIQLGLKVSNRRRSFYIPCLRPFVKSAFGTGVIDIFQDELPVSHGNRERQLPPAYYKLFKQVLRGRRNYLNGIGSARNKKQEAIAAGKIEKILLPYV